MAKKKSQKIINEAQQNARIELKKCNQCNYTTITLSNMNFHVQTNHPITIESDESFNGNDTNHDDNSRVENYAESTTLLINNLKSQVQNVSSTTKHNEDEVEDNNNASEEEEESLAEIKSKFEQDPITFKQMENYLDSKKEVMKATFGTDLDSDDDTEGEEELGSKIKCETENDEIRYFANELNENNFNSQDSLEGEISENANNLIEVEKKSMPRLKKNLIENKPNEGGGKKKVQSFNNSNEQKNTYGWVNLNMARAWSRN